MRVPAAHVHSPIAGQLHHHLQHPHPHAPTQVLQPSGAAPLGDEPTRAVAANNQFADSGRVDALAAHKKSVAGAAKKLEGMMEDAAKVGFQAGVCVCVGMCVY